MTQPTYPVQVWTDTVQSGTFRLVDMGPQAPERFVLERQLDPDSLGGRGWQRIQFQYADALITALKALLRIP